MTATQDIIGPAMGTQQHDLAVILGSRIPIVVVETHEEKRFIDMLLELVTTARGDLYRPLFSWTVTEGLRRLDVDLGAQLHNAEPAKVLRHIRSVDNPGIYALLDFHPYLGDPINVRLLKDIAVHSGHGARTVVLVSHQLELPPELEKLSARFGMALPDDNERATLVAKVVEDWNRDNPGHVAIDKKAFGLLVRNLAGLTRADTERLAREAVYRDGAITSSDLPGTMQAKYEILNRSGVLSFEYETAAFSEVGGLSQLKRWLDQRRVALARQLENLEPPKGLLLIGVQGCGKSLAAKAAAGIFGVPLLRLDFGTLYNKFHGETERRLRESLQQAELMSPCVLWIDELEKGLATGSGDSGVSRRVLGTFLTWMAEKKATVFVVATANEIADLPPELVRKGRFDEIFFVDLPGDEVRADILKIHMKRRDIEAKSFDLAKLVAASRGFSGAEIEQGLVAALYAAHASGEPLVTGHVLAEFQRTRPLSVVMAERVAALRAWADGRTVPAA